MCGRKLEQKILHGFKQPPLLIRVAVLFWRFGHQLVSVPDAAVCINLERNPRQMTSQLSLRFPGTNPNHHLWNNHGTWWCHYTVDLPDFTKRRERINLRTSDLPTTRRRRASLLPTPCKEAE